MWLLRVLFFWLSGHNEGWRTQATAVSWVVNAHMSFVVVALPHHAVCTLIALATYVQAGEDDAPADAGGGSFEGRPEHICHAQHLQ
jgi:hypothetical protein